MNNDFQLFKLIFVMKRCSRNILQGPGFSLLFFPARYISWLMFLFLIFLFLPISSCERLSSLSPPSLTLHVCPRSAIDIGDGPKPQLSFPSLTLRVWCRRSAMVVGEGPRPLLCPWEKEEKLATPCHSPDLSVFFKGCFLRNCVNRVNRWFLPIWPVQHRFVRF